MIKKMKERLKNQKGMTLIELLAVIVILGIIAAIAIPSIGGLIDNSRKDAHVANAQQMISAAKMAVSSDNGVFPKVNTKVYLSLDYLEKKGYMETLKDPDGGLTATDGYARGTAVAADGTYTGAKEESYVEVANTAGKLSYSVALVGSEKSIALTAEHALVRDSVKQN
ncbi:type II secretion system protein [Bacillus benzoevorans]|uniref:Type IV pilus assembly protein PilA n=1 Tax=Bacillus benzoevorans TaxID=1456 RepID=A0A7X0HUM6_9BACI|nr:prepilin-type N-terminal cleavage/methylation domain-containing protein [Bacillus benzoevorans]MBB6445866.1 type IV pilus assembly protein PilA [Bacillus benzoevorans]